MRSLGERRARNQLVDLLSQAGEHFCALNWIESHNFMFLWLILWSGKLHPLSAHTHTHARTHARTHTRINKLNYIQ
jgi:hypothetical protein